MRSRIWIYSLTAGALLAAGAVAPAYAAESIATDSSLSVTIPQAAGDGRDATVAAHVHTMPDMPDMVAATNGMANMHEAMMTHHHPMRPATPGREHGKAEE
ncbi:hypothetical protein E3T24_10250 [Cryobacterium sp. TmT2-59]|uniref:hypothetical protein n=1 Tax=Cryobacterium sp. TmT2-59 TaxID=1259264 RepID=UPI00106C35F7|nr:hypothetical protein [Cryobacterium sp. TmT2-59]TFC84477.1 hypothetical protein E3T24_10250 [Cryobacterium sp. TmT2-59]